MQYHYKNTPNHLCGTSIWKFIYWFYLHKI